MVKQRRMIFLVVFVILIYASHLEQLPRFSSKDMEGKAITMEDLLKTPRVYVLDFWALWCRDCLQFMPHLQDLKKKYKESLLIVSVNNDTTQKASEVRSYIKGKKYDFLVIMDSDFKVKNLLKIQFYPTLLVVNHTGKIVYRHFGATKKAVLEKEIEELIQKLPPRAKEVSPEKRQKKDDAE